MRKKPLIGSIPARNAGTIQVALCANASGGGARKVGISVWLLGTVGAGRGTRTVEQHASELLRASRSIRDDPPDGAHGARQRSARCDHGAAGRRDQRQQRSLRMKCTLLGSERFAPAAHPTQQRARPGMAGIIGATARRTRRSPTTTPCPGRLWRHRQPARRCARRQPYRPRRRDCGRDRIDVISRRWRAGSHPQTDPRMVRGQQVAIRQQCARARGRSRSVAERAA